MAEAIAVATQAAIDDVTRVFFGAFTNKGGAIPDVDLLYRLFIPEAVISKRSGDGCEICGLHDFVEPRRRLLREGRLLEFEEREIAGHTETFGGIAQRFCTYRKAGVLDGRAFAGGGVKMFQFVKLGGDWRISALAWADEPAAPSPSV